MIKRYLLLFAIAFLSFCSYGQRRVFIDSLKRDLLTVQDDSLLFRLYDELAWTYKNLSLDSALAYGELGLSISERLDPQLKAIVLSTIGVTKTENRHADLGISELKAAIEINKQLGLERRLASNYHNIGNAYSTRGPLETAADYYLKSINIHRTTGDLRRLGNALSGLGLVYEKLRDYDKAIEVFEEGMNLFEPSSSRRNRFYNNLGITYMGKGEYQTAKKYFNSILETESGRQSESRFAMVVGNLGECYYKMEKYDSARYFSLQSLEIKQRRNQIGSIAFPAFTLAKTYRKLGKYEEALKYGNIALADSERSKDLENIQDANVILEEIYAQMGDFEKAYQNLTIAYQYQDSLLGTEKIKAINEAQVKYDTEFKDWENQLLKKDSELQSKRIQNQQIIIASIAAILALILALVLILRKQLKERKVLLDQIKGQSSKLQELDQAKTRFFANISHDLRSPLTLILGALDQITERDREIMDNESKELLDLGIKNGKRLLYLADEIMDLTRLEEGKVKLELQHVKVVPYLRLLTKMFSSAADIKHIELTFTSKAEDEVSLAIDPHQFEKIIYNLLSNAIKFTPVNGTVSVDVSTKDDTLEINITDSGPGIPTESLDLIFDRYYQSTDSETSQAGVGIGLALVKELVELHQGTIQASNQETGTTFLIQLPFKKSDWVSSAIIPERSLDIVTRNSLWLDLQEEKERLQLPGIKTPKEDAKSILIVEDHRELRSYLQSILSADFRVFLASNGTTGLDVLQTDHIDLIITDLMMPYMDGFEFVEHLKSDKEMRKIPVIVVSARTDKKEKLELISKGAEDVISKPFDKEELTAKITNILQRDWDSNTQLSKLYADTVEDFEKGVMQKLEKLIIKRISDPHLSVLDLADEMAASERKVYRMIKKISGLTPYELIKEVRWQYLENYLKDHKVKTATEAAQVIGMNNVSSFAIQYEKRFKKSFKEMLD